MIMVFHERLRLNTPALESPLSISGKARTAIECLSGVANAVEIFAVVALSLGDFDFAILPMCFSSRAIAKKRTPCVLLCGSSRVSLPLSPTRLARGPVRRLVVWTPTRYGRPNSLNQIILADDPVAIFRNNQQIGKPSVRA